SAEQARSALVSTTRSSSRSRPTGAPGATGMAFAEATVAGTFEKPGTAPWNVTTTVSFTAAPLAAVGSVSAPEVGSACTTSPPAGGVAGTVPSALRNPTPVNDAPEANCTSKTCWYWALKKMICPVATVNMPSSG